jgi:hypothetical protein
VPPVWLPQSLVLIPDIPHGTGAVAVDPAAIGILSRHLKPPDL